MKKIVFFDGDGTLWYPESTKRTKPPHWVYFDKNITDPFKEFVVTPTAVETLTALGEKGVKRVLLSTSPLSEEEAIMSRIKAAQHVDIHHLLDDVQVAPDYREGKGERITVLLEKYGLNSEDAIMVGDTFGWDYLSAQDVGVDGLLIRSNYQSEFIAELDPSQVIDNLSDLLNRI